MLAARAATRSVAVLALLALAACGTSVPPTSPPPSSPPPVPRPEGWTLLPGSPASPANSRHDDIVFLDPSRGWLVNVRGEVHRTTDGGTSWERVGTLPGAFPRCVGFASAEKGWIGNINTTAGRITPDSALFETVDGGRSWANISLRIQGPPVVGLCGMRVVTPTAIYAVGRWNGPAVFVKSADGGRTWSSKSLEGLASGLVDLFFFNEQDGVAVGGLGVGSAEAEQRASRTVILATADGGETWQPRYVSTNQGEWAWKVQFATDRVGYVTTEGPSPEGVVLKTTDGGQAWGKVAVSAGSSFEGVGFVTAERGWVASGQSLHSTADGGATWRRLDFGTAINRMRVVSPTLAYAAGDRVYRWTGATGGP